MTKSPEVIKVIDLMDIYPVGDLAGCKVYEAIDHNPQSVEIAHNNGCFRLGYCAIQRLVNRLNPKRR